MKRQQKEKLVCVQAVPSSAVLHGFYAFPKGYLQHGKTYTVRKKTKHVFASKNGWYDYPCVFLQEIQCFRNGTEIPFQRFRFRKAKNLTKNVDSVKCWRIMIQFQNGSSKQNNKTNRK